MQFTRLDHASNRFRQPTVIESRHPQGELLKALDTRFLRDIVSCYAI